MKNYPKVPPPKWKILKYEGELSDKFGRYRFKGPGYTLSITTFETYEEACYEAWRIWELDERDKPKNWKEVTE